MSFGIESSEGLEAAVVRAVAGDVVLVAAVANKNDNAVNRYPAAFPDVLAVGASNRNGRLADFSRPGSDVDIVAPETDIPVADPTLAGGYGIVDGTSPAAAIVAGAAALVRARYAQLSARQVVDRLTSTAVDKGPPGRDDAYGFGELDLVGALTAPVGRPTPPTSQPVPT